MKRAAGWPSHRLVQGLQVPLDQPSAVESVHLHMAVRETQGAAVVAMPDAEGIDPLPGLRLHHRHPGGSAESHRAGDWC